MRIYYGGDSTSPVWFCWFFVFRGSRFPRRLLQLRRWRGACMAFHVRKGKVRASGSGRAVYVSRVSQAFYPCALHIIVNNKRDYAGGNPAPQYNTQCVILKRYYGSREPAKIDLLRRQLVCRQVHHLYYTTPTGYYNSILSSLATSKLGFYIFPPVSSCTQQP